jgi:hypothetical protein
MDVLAMVVQGKRAEIATQFGVAVQRTAMDTAKSQAAELLRTVPPPITLEPGRGQTIDRYA